jgi:hypothetical protein
VVATKSNSNSVIEETVFLPSGHSGALRILKADGEKLTLISTEGVVFIFDITTMQFISLPAGSNIEKIHIIAH